MGPEDVLIVVDYLATAGIRSWLAGGWGLDALAGTETRPHRDLDLLVDADDADAAEQHLGARGFERIREALPGSRTFVPWSLMPHRVFLRDRDGRTVDLHPVRSADWPGLPAVPHAFAVGTVGGREVQCLSVAAQVATHQGFEIREEHRADMELLGRLQAAGDRREPA
jgi:lincosamide nucleotidyltransferase A/C/D/E